MHCEIVSWALDFVWAIQAQKRLSNNTTQAYIKDLKIFANFIQTEFHASSLMQLDFDKVLEKYLLYLKGNFAKATCARRISTCFQFLEFVANEKMKKEMNFERPKVKVDNLYTVFLENEDLEKIRSILGNSKSDIRLRAMIEILYSTGMRSSELLQIKIKDIHTIYKNKHLLIKGKGEHERYVFFNDLSIACLEEYIKSWGIVKEDEFLFVNKLASGKKKALTRQRLFQLLKEISKKANVDETKVFAHALRHRMLTNLVLQGADLISVQQIAGHKQINTSARYTHVEDHLYKDIENLHPIKKITKS